MALNTFNGKFEFGPDFYQANAKLTLIATGQELIPALAVGQHYGADPVGKGPVH